MATETEPQLTAVDLDLRTLTLGELAEVEMASGKTAAELWRSRLARRMMAVYIVQLRAHRRSPSSVPPPSWSDLSDRRLIDAPSST